MNASAAASTPRSGVVSDASFLRALLAGAPEYLYFKDLSSRFIAVSDSLVRALGKSSRAEVLGRTDFDFYAPEHAQPRFDDEQEIARTGRPIVDKLEELILLDGNRTWVITTKAPVRRASGEIIGIFGLSKDVTAQRQMRADVEKAHRDLVEASRMAGMAEVATGVLHNVGNVLNSLNVSASVVATGLRQSKVESLGKVAALLQEHAGDLREFLTTDTKGKRIPEYISSVAKHTITERDRLLHELASLQKNIDHIKETVAMQQAYATMIGVLEPLDGTLMMEDAARMNAESLQRHHIRIERDFAPIPRVLGEQAKVLQILVNFIRNAQHACDENPRADKCLTLRLRPAVRDRVEFVVEDNGIGIPPENLTKIFQHGFTTRSNGHGFGLHSSANAAREMNGSITAHSAGRGLGATFILNLPAATPAAAAS